MAYKINKGLVYIITRWIITNPESLIPCPLDVNNYTAELEVSI